MEDLDLPAHRVPFDFLDSLNAACDLKVGEQLPFDALSGGARLDSVDGRNVQRWIPLLHSDRRQDRVRLKRTSRAALTTSPASLRTSMMCWPAAPTSLI